MEFVHLYYDPFEKVFFDNSRPHDKKIIGRNLPPYGEPSLVELTRTGGFHNYERALGDAALNNGGRGPMPSKLGYIMGRKVIAMNQIVGASVQFYEIEEQKAQTSVPERSEDELTSR